MILMKEIIDCIKSGEKDRAIVLVGDAKDMDVREAKRYVDEMERKISAGAPIKIERSIDISPVDCMEGHEFEYFCAKLLSEVGFSEVKVTSGSGDQGVDILALKDGTKYAIQCKNYARALSNTPVQEVSAGRLFYGCHVGVVMTNSTFTTGSRQLADATNVVLWDRTKLEELISAAGGLENLGVYVEHEEVDANSSAEYNKLWRIENTGYRFHNEGPMEHNQERQRWGMNVWSYICFAWGIICAFIFLLGLCTALKECVMVGVSEGLFAVVLGMMFKILAKT